MKSIIEVVEKETVKRIYSCEFDYNQFIDWLDGEEPTEEMLKAYIYDELLEEASYNEFYLDNSIDIKEDLNEFLKMQNFFENE